MGGGAGGGAGAASATASSGSGGGTGVLTAGAWDDNLNFDFFLGYLDATKPEGTLVVPRTDRLVLRVRDQAGLPLAGAHVEVSQGGAALFAADSSADGDVLLFPAWSGASAQAPLSIQAHLGSDVVSQPAPPGTKELTLTLAQSTASPVDGVDIAVVLDTTGSMGDELTWLQREVASISADVSARYAGLPQRWALVLYRDEGDDYLTRVTDFTTLSAFQAALAGASSGGGGDYAEAVHAAVAAAAQLSWSPGAHARLAFHIADAPQHPDKNPELLAALAAVRAKSVHYYPVAASGVDEQFEQTFRTLAEMTGGRYLFLTNDSGIGGDHKEPTLPCYFVTSLHQAMVRMIAMELAGRYLDPAPGDVLRTSGSPVARQCTLSDGTVVVAL
jgi:hypothetical protein